MGQERREMWPDVMKCMLMLMVVLHHDMVFGTNAQQLYTPYFMCGFFFISGCFFKGANMTFVDFLYKKVRGLLIPYLLIGSVCYFIGSAYKEWCAGGTEYFHWKAYCRNYLLFGNYYWFVCCLFVAQFIQYFIVRLSCSRDGVVLGLSAVTSLISLTLLIDDCMVTLPWYMHIACVMQWPMNLGYVLMKKRYLERLKHGWIAGVSAIVYLGVWGYACFVLHLPKISDMAGAYHHIGVYLLLVHTGLLCCISISQLLRPIPLILLIGRNTLCIYFVHFMVIWFFGSTVSGWYESLCRILGIPQLIFLRGVLIRPSAFFVGLLLGVVVSLLVKNRLPWVMGMRARHKLSS